MFGVHEINIEEKEEEKRIEIKNFCFNFFISAYGRSQESRTVRRHFSQVK